MPTDGNGKSKSDKRSNQLTVNDIVDIFISAHVSKLKHQEQSTYIINKHIRPKMAR